MKWNLQAIKIKLSVSFNVRLTGASNTATMKSLKLPLLLCLQEGRIGNISSFQTYLNLMDSAALLHTSIIVWGYKSFLPLSYLLYTHSLPVLIEISPVDLNMHVLVQDFSSEIYKEEIKSEIKLKKQSDCCVCIDHILQGVIQFVNSFMGKYVEALYVLGPRIESDTSVCPISHSVWTDPQLYAGTTSFLLYWDKGHHYETHLPYRAKNIFTIHSSLFLF